MKLRKHWQQWIPFYGVYYIIVKVPLDDWHEYSVVNNWFFLSNFWHVGCFGIGWRIFMTWVEA